MVTDLDPEHLLGAPDGHLDLWPVVGLVATRVADGVRNQFTCEELCHRLQVAAETGAHCPHPTTR